MRGERSGEKDAETRQFSHLARQCIHSPISLPSGLLTVPVDHRNRQSRVARASSVPFISSLPAPRESRQSVSLSSSSQGLRQPGNLSLPHLISPSLVSLPRSCRQGQPLSIAPSSTASFSLSLHPSSAGTSSQPSGGPFLVLPPARSRALTAKVSFSFSA